MKKNEMYRVYPTEYVPGFCDSYCKTEMVCWDDLFIAETALIVKRNEAKDKLTEFLRKKPCQSDRLWKRTCAHLQFRLRQACEELNALREQYGSCI